MDWKKLKESAEVVAELVVMLAAIYGFAYLVYLVFWAWDIFNL